MSAFLEYCSNFWQLLTSMGLGDIFEILVVAYFVYRLLRMIQSTNTYRIAKAIVFVLLLSWITDLAKLHMLNFLVGQVLQIGLIALVILFQPEMRRVLEHVGGKSLKELLNVKQQVRELDTVIAQTVSACEVMSKEKTGALIVFERKVRLDEYFKTGTVIDGRVSEQLYRNIFFPKAALHDGALIVREDRVAVAGCVLPLSDNSHLSADLGTRHRAGVGVSEVSDAVVVIVSEETGTISVAVGGMLKRHLAAQTLERLLRNELMPAADNQPKTIGQRLRQSLKKKDDSHEK